MPMDVSEHRTCFLARRFIDVILGFAPFPHVGGYSNLIRSWLQTTCSAPVKSSIAAVKSTGKLTVVFTVAVVVLKGITARDTLSWITAMEAATDPLLPIERTVINARRCQLALPPAAVRVHTVVEPSFKVKVTDGPFAPGSATEPKASNMKTLRAARAPGGIVAPESKRVAVPAVETTFTEAAFT